jgi:hypothetical protein
MRVLIFATTLTSNISHFKKKSLRQMWKRLQVKYSLFLSDFNETWIFWMDFRTSIKYQILLNPWIVSRIVRYGQKDGQTDGRTNITKLTVAVCNFANALQNVRDLTNKCWNRSLILCCTVTKYLFKNTNFRTSSYKISHIFINFNQFCSLSTEFLKVCCFRVHENLSSWCHAGTWEQMDGQTDNTMKIKGALCYLCRHT